MRNSASSSAASVQPVGTRGSSRGLDCSRRRAGSAGAFAARPCTTIARRMETTALFFIRISSGRCGKHLQPGEKNRESGNGGGEFRRYQLRRPVVPLVLTRRDEREP